MAVFVVFATVEFFDTSTMVEAQPAQAAQTASADPWTEPGQKPSSFAEEMQYRTSVAAYRLELQSLAEVHKEASAAFVVRLATRFVGFLTGMILALVGAMFVVGKLQEQPTQLDSKAEAWSVSFSSSSPGLVLAALGTVIMGLAMTVPVSGEMREAAVYFPLETTIVQGSTPDQAGQTEPAGGGSPAITAVRRAEPPRLGVRPVLSPASPPLCCLMSGVLSDMVRLPFARKIAAAAQGLPASALGFTQHPNGRLGAVNLM